MDRTCPPQSPNRKLIRRVFAFIFVLGLLALGGAILHRAGVNALNSAIAHARSVGICPPAGARPLARVEPQRERSRQVLTAFDQPEFDSVLRELHRDDLVPPCDPMPSVRFVDAEVEQLFRGVQYDLDPDNALCLEPFSSRDVNIYRNVAVLRGRSAILHGDSASFEEAANALFDLIDGCPLHTYLDAGAKQSVSNALGFLIQEFARADLGTAAQYADLLRRLAALDAHDRMSEHVLCHVRFSVWFISTDDPSESRQEPDDVVSWTYRNAPGWNTFDRAAAIRRFEDCLSIDFDSPPIALSFLRNSATSGSTWLPAAQVFHRFGLQHALWWPMRAKAIRHIAAAACAMRLYGSTDMTLIEERSGVDLTDPFDLAPLKVQVQGDVGRILSSEPSVPPFEMPLPSIP